MQHLIKILKALSDVNRLTIVKLLQRQSLCVCEIEALLPIAQPTISSHLRTLTNANLIKSEKQGLWVIYSLVDDEQLAELKPIMQDALDYLEKTGELKPLFKKLKTLNLREVCKK
jgi:ArsR family transcriptional regulator, arsenate/arsenite/antimonite-responsive transcriptional repressor